MKKIKIILEGLGRKVLLLLIGEKTRNPVGFGVGFLVSLGVASGLMGSGSGGAIEGRSGCGGVFCCGPDGENFGAGSRILC